MWFVNVIILLAGIYVTISVTHAHKIAVVYELEPIGSVLPLRDNRTLANYNPQGLDMTQILAPRLKELCDELNNSNAVQTYLDGENHLKTIILTGNPTLFKVKPYKNSEPTDTYNVICIECPAQRGSRSLFMQVNNSADDPELVAFFPDRSSDEEEGTIYHNK